MQVLSEINRTIVYSLSPGTSVTPSMARDVSALTNMYRITGDDWDTWGDVAAHFDVTRYNDIFDLLFQPLVHLLLFVLILFMQFLL